MPISIRPLMPSDHARWLELWQGYQRFYNVTLPDEATDATWARLSDDAEPVYGLGAARDGVLIGFTHYLFHRSTWSVAETCYLQDLFVDPAHRGQGTAGALIAAVSAKADQRSGGLVYWITHQGNTTARRLYDKMAAHAGFIVYERTPGETRNG